MATAAPRKSIAAPVVVPTTPKPAVSKKGKVLKASLVELQSLSLIPGALGEGRRVRQFPIVQRFYHITLKNSWIREETIALIAENEKKRDEIADFLGVDRVEIEDGQIHAFNADGAPPKGPEKAFVAYTYDGFGCWLLTSLKREGAALLKKIPYAQTFASLDSRMLLNNMRAAIFCTGKNDLRNSRHVLLHPIDTYTAIVEWEADHISELTLKTYCKFRDHLEANPKNTTVPTVRPVANMDFARWTETKITKGDVIQYAEVEYPDDAHSTLCGMNHLATMRGFERRKKKAAAEKRKATIAARLDAAVSISAKV